MRTSFLTPHVPNKVYFQVQKIDEHIEFDKAELIEINHESGENKSLSQIAHIHNGRSNFTFIPQPDIFKYDYKLRVYRNEETFKEFNLTGVNPFYTTMMTIEDNND